MHGAWGRDQPAVPPPRPARTAAAGAPPHPWPRCVRRHPAGRPSSTRAGEPLQLPHQVLVVRPWTPVECEQQLQQLPHAVGGVQLGGERLAVAGVLDGPVERVGVGVQRDGRRVERLVLAQERLGGDAVRDLPVEPVEQDPGTGEELVVGQRGLGSHVRHGDLPGARRAGKRGPPLPSCRREGGRSVRGGRVPPHRGSTHAGDAIRPR
jgi:hypothetical protein